MPTIVNGYDDSRAMSPKQMFQERLRRGPDGDRERVAVERDARLAGSKPRGLERLNRLEDLMNGR